MAKSKWMKNLQGELPIMITMAPFVIAFCLLCWVMAQFISWLGVIFLLVGIHWFCTRDPPAPSPVELKKRQSTHVVIVGAGYSGLCMAIKLKAARVPFIILEKSATLGGTWYDNTYPGCACDIMSHLYSFSFFPNPFWSRSFPSQPEILAYLKKVAFHYDLLPSIRFGVRVNECRWDEEKGLWTVLTAAGESFVGNFLVSGIGALHVPKTPDFKGKDDFEGVSFHTAQWDHGFDYRGKDVAVIGTGASAVQAVPAIVDDVKSVTVFQRTAVWTSPRLDFFYPSFLQGLFDTFPLIMKLHRWYIFVRQEIGFFAMFGKGSKRGEQIRRQVTNYMLSHVTKPELKKKVIPDFDMGCKRITVSNDYVKSLNSPNARLVTDKIDRIASNGVVVKRGGADGAEGEKEEEELIPCDAIVYATGFDLMASCKNMTVRGRGGLNLGDVWGSTPNAYLGVSCPDFPNLFYLLGPNVGLGHNSIVWMIECQVTYIMDAILRCVRDEVKSIEVKRSVNRAFQEYIQGLMKFRVFHSGCKSWYQNADGIIYTLWPSHLLHYWWFTKKINMDDYVIDRA